MIQPRYVLNELQTFANGREHRGFCTERFWRNESRPGPIAFHGGQPDSLRTGFGTNARRSSSNQCASYDIVYPCAPTLASVRREQRLES